MSEGGWQGGRVRPLHWAGRFARSVWPGGPDPEELEWADWWLSDRESALLRRMSNNDRRHALAVARGVEVALTGPGAPELDEGELRAVMAAALLHDVGKTVAGLGTYGRVVATLSGLVASDYAEAWQQTSGFTRRVGLYLRYTELGAELLEVNEAHPWVVAWSREHHHPEEAWSIPVEVGRILVAADG